MDIDKISILAGNIAEREHQLEQAKLARSRLDFKGHQERLIVKIGGIELEVSQVDRSGSSRIKKGYDMVHLGVVRLYNEEIDQLEKEIAEKEKELRNFVMGG